jgi:sialate O-acetylesterase
VSCTPDTVGAFSAVGYYFARAIHRSLSVLVGIINSSWGGTRVEAWTSLDALRGVMNVDVELADRDRPRVDRAMPEPFAEPNAPAALFHGMIAPLLPFGLRGVIWYQGESNVDNHAVYRDRFVALIRDWRTRWGAGDDRAATLPTPPGPGPLRFPFYFVQLEPRSACVMGGPTTPRPIWKTTPDCPQGHFAPTDTERRR